MSQNNGRKVTGKVSRKDSGRVSNEGEMARKLSKKLTFVSGNKVKRAPVKSNTKVSDKQEDSVEFIDADQIAELTKSVKNRVLDSMANFKSAASNFISENTELVNELNGFQGDLNHLKLDVFQILSESSATQSRLQDSKVTLKAVSIKPKEYNEKPSSAYSLSLEGNLKNRESLKSLNEKLVKLKSEVNKLREHMNDTEEKVTEAEEENTELKNLTSKLQLFSELPTERGLCSSCSVF